MREYRNSALTGLTIGFVGVAALLGAAFYSGIKETAKVMAPVMVSNPAKVAEKPPLRKSDKLERRQVRQLPLGPVFRWDVSLII